MATDEELAGSAVAAYAKLNIGVAIKKANTTNNGRKTADVYVESFISVEICQKCITYIINEKCYVHHIK